MCVYARTHARTRARMYVCMYVGARMNLKKSVMNLKGIYENPKKSVGICRNLSRNLWESVRI